MRRRVKAWFRDLRHDRLGRPWFDVRPTDRFFASWPRSGNTWMRLMVLHALDPERDWHETEVERVAPIVDRPGLRRMLRERGAEANPAAPLRLFKTHDRFQPYHLRGRVAYLLRDGRDATLSFHHYRTRFNRKTFDLSEFVRRTLRGEFRYGAWHEHVEGWLAHRDDPSLLVVRYEDVLADPAAALARVLAHFEIEATPQRIEQAVQRCSVQRVAATFQQAAERKAKSGRGGAGFTGGLGGGSGRWREAFSPRDRAHFERHAGETLARLGYPRDDLDTPDSRDAPGDSDASHSAAPVGAASHGG